MWKAVTFAGSFHRKRSPFLSEEGYATLDVRYSLHPPRSFASLEDDSAVVAVCKNVILKHFGGST